MKVGLADQLGESGWVNADGTDLESLVDRPPKFAILAPPLDTVPSEQGHAIYVLVERIASLARVPCVILSKWPNAGVPSASSVSDRILYFRSPLRPGVAGRLPYRVKKLVWGSGAPHLLRYAVAAGTACRLLGVESVLIQDVPMFAPPIRKRVGSSMRLLLHQHCNAPSYFSSRRWRMVTKTLDGIVFVSDQSRQSVEVRHGMLTVPSWVVFNGVDLEHYNPNRFLSVSHRLRAGLGIGPDDFVLLFAGRLLPNKGPAEAAEALTLTGLDDAHLLIAGSFDVPHYRDEPYLERLRIATGKSEEKVHLLGNVPQSNLPAYYSAADVVITPSIGSEGLSKVITEALAMGRPVIASDRGGAWELLREAESGWMIDDPSDPRSIATAIRRAYFSRQRFSETSAEIIKTIRPRLSEGRMVRQLETLALEG